MPVISKRKGLVICVIFLLFTTLYFEFHNSISKSPETSISKEDEDLENYFGHFNTTNSKATNFVGSGSIFIHSLLVDTNFIMKGKNVEITLDIESEVTLDEISLSIYFTSIPSEYGLYYYQDYEQDGYIDSLVLEAKIDIFSEQLNANERKEIGVSVGPLEFETKKHAFLPLNRGSWKITKISFSSSEGTSEYLLLDNLVINVIMNPSEHIVFAYFVHNHRLPFPDGHTIRYALDKAIDRLENSYSFSIKIMVLEEDDSWKPDDSLINGSQMVEDAWKHVGAKLNLLNNTWDFVPNYDLYEGVWTETKSANGGFDLLLAASNRPGDVLGIAGYAGNWGYVSGGRYNLLNYLTTISQYDNIMQHEISHIFGAHDRPGSETIMDTTAYFNGTHFTSPSLEFTNYLQNDLIHIEHHASRFDGSLNPTPPRILGKETILSTTDKLQWFHPKAAISENELYPIIHFTAGLKHSSNNIILYHGTLYGKTWSNFNSISSSNYNSTKFSNFVDSDGNFHAAWIGVNTSNSIGTLYYRMRTNLGAWKPVVIIDNENNSIDCSLSVDNSGKVHLLYNILNGSNSTIQYLTKGNDNWSSIKQLPNSSLSSYNPKVLIDDDNCIHFYWSEINDATLKSEIYYSNYNNTVFSSKEQIYVSKTNAQISNIQMIYDVKTENSNFLWEEKNDSSTKLSFCEKLSNGTVTSVERLYEISKNTIIDSYLFLSDSGELDVYWQKPNKLTNQTFILYKIRSIAGNWSFVNRFSSLEGNYYNPFLIQDHNRDMHLIYCSYDYSTSSSSFYSRVYDKLIFPFDYGISISSFNFSYYSSYSQNGFYIELSCIEAISDYPEIGVLDSISKAIYHNFGVWRIGEGYPLVQGILNLDTFSGTWNGEAFVEDAKPGVYIVIVAFMDSNYVYSGHFASLNSYIIEDDTKENGLSENMLILIISLSVGVPVIITASIVPTVILRKKKCQ